MKKTWMKDIRRDMDAKGLNENILVDQNERRTIIPVIDLAYFSFGLCCLSLSQVLRIKILVVVCNF